MPLTRNRRERGNAIIEFALVSVFLLPILYGVYSIGMSLARTLSAAVVARDAGAMFMRTVDFTQAQNAALLVRIGQDLGLQSPGGNGVVVMSRVYHVTSADCLSGGYSATGCPNYDQVVFSQRVSVGNTTSGFFTSAFGTPASSIVRSDGTIALSDYVSNTSARVSNATALPTLAAGEVAYISEAYFITPSLDLPGYRTNTNLYQRNIF